MRLCREISAGQYRPPGISAATRGTARSCPRRRCSGPCPRGSPSSPPVPAPVGQPSGAAGERYLFTHLFTHSPQLPGRGWTEQHYLNGSPNHTSAGQNRFGWSGIIFVKGHLSDFNPWSGVRDPGGPLAEHQAKGMLRIAGPPRGAPSRLVLFTDFFRPGRPQIGLPNLERQSFVLGIQVHAAKVAAVGDGDPQIGRPKAWVMLRARPPRGAGWDGSLSAVSGSAWGGSPVASQR